MNRADHRQIVISTDGHCGADVLDYKPYLESRYYELFDAWARDFHDPWQGFDDEHSIDFRGGITSFESTLNWDSKRREEILDADGVAGEVLLPNTSPPFFPSNMITAPGPQSAEEYELRWAGLQAHNRWLVDFCKELPGRRAGFVQLFLDDVDAAVEEVRWAKDSGLRGVLLPPDHFQKLIDLYHPRYEPLWAVCEELQMPINRHGIMPASPVTGPGDAATWIGSFEAGHYAMRGVWELICAGVFERFPGLKMVTIEFQGAIILQASLDRLDGMFEAATTGRAKTASWRIDEAVSKLSRKPSEYFATNCYLGGPLDHKTAYDLGLPNLMFGTDLPHNEGTAPYTRLALRRLFAGVPEDEVEQVVAARAAEVYGFDLAELQGVADRIGPTMGEITTPLPESDWPSYPEETRSPAFRRDDDPMWKK